MAQSPPDSGVAPDAAPDVAPVPGKQTERRIAWLTLAIGFSEAVALLLAGRAAWAAGIAIGAALGWLNGRAGIRHHRTGRPRRTASPIGHVLYGAVPLRLDSPQRVCYFYLSARSPGQLGGGVVCSRSRGDSG